MNNKISIITCLFFGPIFAQPHSNYADERLSELHNEIIMNTSSWYETCPHKTFFEPIPFIQGANVNKTDTITCGGTTEYRTIPTLYYEKDTPYVRLEAEHKHSDTSNICITSVESDTQIFQIDFQRISMLGDYHIVKVNKMALNFWRLRTGNIETTTIHVDLFVNNLLDLSGSDEENSVIQHIGNKVVTGDFDSSIYLMELDDKVQLLLQYQVDQFDPHNGTVTQSGVIVDETAAAFIKTDENETIGDLGVQLISSEFDRIPAKHPMIEKTQIFLNDGDLIRAWDSKTMNHIDGKDYSKAFWMPFHNGPDVPVHTISLDNRHLLMKEVVGSNDFEIPPMKLEVNNTEWLVAINYQRNWISKSIFAYNLPVRKIINKTGILSSGQFICGNVVDSHVECQIIDTVLDGPLLFKVISKCENIKTMSVVARKALSFDIKLPRSKQLDTFHICTQHGVCIESGVIDSTVVTAVRGKDGVIDKTIAVKPTQRSKFQWWHYVLISLAAVMGLGMIIFTIRKVQRGKKSQLKRVDRVKRVKPCKEVV